ncbi:MAG: hypothetical protein SGPRY_013697, partial [Prymnesium sp.]
MWADALYLSHALLELPLGLIKLRGRYAHEAPASRPLRSHMYTRHHAVSILSLALLAALLLARGLVDSEAGQLCSLVLMSFHAGAVLVFAYTWRQGAIPLSKVIIPHLPFAI